MRWILSRVHPIPLLLGLMLMAAGAAGYHWFGRLCSLECDRSSCLLVQGQGLRPPISVRFPLAALQVIVTSVPMHEDSGPYGDLALRFGGTEAVIARGPEAGIQERAAEIRAFATPTATQPRLEMDFDERPLGLSVGLPPFLVGVFLVAICRRKA